MADFLTIAGIAYPVDRQGAGETAREYAGSLRRAFDNTLRNMTRSAKRPWQLTLAPITQTQWETLDAATSLRQSVAVTGTMFGTTTPAAVCITATAIPHLASGESHLRTVVITMQEV
jgi:hypothetical protein